MKVIKIKFEYGCFPVWIYGENNELIENDLPPYLIGDSDIDPEFLNIQKIYDSLYLDDGKEFKYRLFIRMCGIENRLKSA